MNAICECARCKQCWTCAAEDDFDTNSMTLTGEQQVCPACGSEEFTIVDAEYLED